MQLSPLVSSDLEHLLATQYFSGRLLPCQGSSDIFVPLLKILDQLLVIGVIQEDKDLRRLLELLDPEQFTPSSTKSEQDAACNTYQVLGLGTTRVQCNGGHPLVMTEQSSS